VISSILVSTCLFAKDLTETHKWRYVGGEKLPQATMTNGVFVWSSQTFFSRCLGKRYGAVPARKLFESPRFGWRSSVPPFPSTTDSASASPSSDWASGGELYAFWREVIGGRGVVEARSGDERDECSVLEEEASLPLTMVWVRVAVEVEGSRVGLKGGEVGAEVA
jgi:hypothetical protein